MQTFTAKTIGLVRTLAPALLGAMLPLLSLFAAAAAAVIVAPEARAQVTLDYTKNDPRYATEQPCQALDGQLTIFASGEKVCSDIDTSGTFCIVGSQDAFPCAGLYKRVVKCNREYNRIAINPFICGETCSMDGDELARGKGCVGSFCTTPTQTVTPCDNLESAIVYNDINCARQLIAGGHLINDSDLHDAADHNSCQVAQLLIKNGANPNAKDWFDETPLHDAAFRESVETAELLLIKGANVNAKDLSDTTPLHIAASGDDDMVELLLENGADVNVKNWRDHTPFHVAVLYGQDGSGAVNLLETQDDGYTPLHKAAYNNNTNMVANLLVIVGAQVDAKDISGWTPLHFAAANNSTDAAQLLLLSTAVEEALLLRSPQANTQNNFGDTPLHFAAISGTTDMAETLLLFSANINAKNNYDGTPLLEAAVNDNYDIAKLLINNGAEVNAKDIFDLTPLHWSFDSINTMKRLLDKGAKINAEDNNGNTPLDFAIRYGYQDGQEFLRARGGKCNTEC